MDEMEHLPSTPDDLDELGLALDELVLQEGSVLPEASTSALAVLGSKTNAYDRKFLLLMLNTNPLSRVAPTLPPVNIVQHEPIMRLVTEAPAPLGGIVIEWSAKYSKKASNDQTSSSRRGRNSDGARRGRPGRGGQSQVGSLTGRQKSSVQALTESNVLAEDYNILLIHHESLQLMLMSRPEVIVHSLTMNKIKLELLLKEQNITGEKFFLFISVLARAATCGDGQSLLDLFTTVFNSRFIEKLLRFQMFTLSTAMVNFVAVHKQQLDLLKSYVQLMPRDALDKLPDLLKTITLVLKKAAQMHDDSDQIRDLVAGYDELGVYVDGMKCTLAPVPQKPCSSKNRLAYLDSYEPSNSFRGMPVEPTEEDVNLVEAPVIRRNIVKGKYKDVETYLEVQFTLMREDFMRPLREGINAYRNKDKDKIDSVRVYHNVTFVHSEVSFGKKIDYIRVKLPRHFNPETSKRLIFGNLLCFSHNDFKTFSLATIAQNLVVKQLDGVLGITWLPAQAAPALSSSYTMIESVSFYVPHKHVLTVLQSLDKFSLPFANHIVDVETEVKPPKYIEYHLPEYDLRVVLNERYMHDAGRHDISCYELVNYDSEDDYSRFGYDDYSSQLIYKHDVFFGIKCPSITPPCDGHSALQGVHLAASLEDWPTAQQMALDESQRKALHAALTKRVVMIQGPPGTGKTFIGLKITQTLMHNALKLGEDAPILVVCFTNHALDQFLEGVKRFTNRVVRIGGRSENEELKEHQIKKLDRVLANQEYARFKGNKKGYYESEKSKIFRSMKIVEKDYNNLQKNLKGVKLRVGLISFECLFRYKIIPSDIIEQFKLVSPDSWLFPEEELTNPPSEEDACELGPESAQELENLRSSESASSVGGEDEDGKRYRHPPGDCFSVTLHQYQQQLDLLKIQLEVDEISLEHYEEYVAEITSEMECLRKFLAYRKCFDSERERINIHELTVAERWQLYNSWSKKFEDCLAQQMRKLELEAAHLASELKDVSLSRHYRIAKCAAIVGMTSTGAAERRDLLDALQPRIVIIEEAGQILESHVVSALPSSTQHLIMIGDHQQLRPSTAVYELASKYDLDTSLFERLINNGLPYVSLQLQHRMRPEISRLLVPAIYPGLLDAPSVLGRPPVLGLRSNVYFVQHQHHETQVQDDNRSHENPHEASFVLQLARYLLLQGYSTDRITILTPYSGQLHLLRKEQLKVPSCGDIRLSIVDNYQGEENDLILLSLVRSNATGSVGFLSIANRVCVALSRAKLGLYIIGNMDQLCSSGSLWQKMREALAGMDAVGDRLTLCCQNHPQDCRPVATGAEIAEQSPEGGCRERCDHLLPRCGHPCHRWCHVDDPDHLVDRCAEPCPKLLCSRDHPCPALCHQDCPNCLVPLLKELPCGHQHHVPCFVYDKFLCSTDVAKVVPGCGHTVQMACHADPANFECSAKVTRSLSCGHPIELACHLDLNPVTLSRLCDQPCMRPNAKCSTGEHRCRKACMDECEPCPFSVKKRLSCGHSVRMVCSEPAPRFSSCKSKCKRLLRCGHHCQLLCQDDCPQRCLKCELEAS